MARTTTSPVQNYPYPHAAVFDAATRVLNRLPATIASADPATGTIVGTTPMTWRSWGERLEVRVWEDAPGSTAVTLTSKASFQLVDWGKNKINAERFFSGLASYVEHNLAHLRTDTPPPAT